MGCGNGDPHLRRVRRIDSCTFNWRDKAISPLWEGLDVTRLLGVVPQNFTQPC